ncbi:MAG: hypothetical protein HYR51_15695 [Candidatus Rokubacteria bacterium]|nr:hypothetical protein [Candidatus Rokubacteria bacterium]
MNPRSMGALAGRSLSPALGAVLGAGLVTLLAVLVAWPVLALLGPARAAAAAGPVLTGLATTALVALVSTLVTVSVAGALAYLATRARGAPSRALVVAMALPLVLPPFAAALALRIGLDAVGAAPVSAVGGMLAVCVAQIVSLLPFAFAIIGNTMRRIDVELEDAAVSLGAAPATALGRVTLVLARPGVGCAALVVLALALADVASPLAVGSAAPFLSVRVVAAAHEGDIALAAAGSLALAVPCLIVWIAALRAGWTRLGALPIELATRPVPPSTRATARAGVVMVVATGALLGVYALVPVAGLRAPVGTPIAHVVATVGASLRVAVAVALVGAMLAFAFSVVAARLPIPAARRLAWLGFATAGVPGVAIALGYLVAFDVTAASAPLWMPIAALATWKLPAAVALLTRRMRALDPALEEVAVSLGADNAAVARRIVAPLLAPALAATFLDLVVQALASASLLLLVATGISASASALTRVAAGDVAGSATLVTGLAVVTVLVVLVRAWLAPREPLALLPA